MRLRILAFACVIAVLMPALSTAQTLQDRLYQKDALAGIQKQLESSNKQCGSSISGEFDWSNVDFERIHREKYTASGECAAAADALYLFCRDKGDLAKEAVKEKIKKLVCKFGEKNLELKNGVLSFTMSLDDKINQEGYVRKFLLENL